MDVLKCLGPNIGRGLTPPLMANRCSPNPKAQRLNAER